MWLVTSPISILKVLCFPHCVAVLTTLSNLSWLFMHEFISGLYSRMFWPKQLSYMFRKWINLKASSFILLYWGSFSYARSFKDPCLFHNLFSISVEKVIRIFRDHIVLHQTTMFLLREKKLSRPEEGVRSQETGVTNNCEKPYWRWELNLGPLGG